MTSRQTNVLLVLTACACLAVYGRYIPAALKGDPFGLWSDSGAREIYQNERLSKFLMARNYVPTRFDGFLTGPSYAANLDTRKISGTRTYNLAVSGANASELKHVVTPALKSGRLRYMIVCLDPYLVKDHGFKDNSLQWETWFHAAVLSGFAKDVTERAAGVGTVADCYADSAAGWNNFDLQKERDHVDFTKIARAWDAEPAAKEEIRIDAVGYDDLKSIIDAAHENGVKVFAYYFPLSDAAWRRFYEAGWPKFRAKLDALFGPDDVVWDMNSAEYAALRADLTAYSDGHLNQRGAAVVLADIESKLRAHGIIRGP